MSDTVWRPSDPAYAVIDWRAVRYIGLTWDDGIDTRACTARVLDMELRNGRPVIEARDLGGNRELVLDPQRSVLRKRVDGTAVEVGSLGLIETREEEDVKPEWQGVDGHEPDEVDVQAGLPAWGGRP